MVPRTYSKRLEVYFFFALFLGVIVISFFIFSPYLYSLILAVIFAIIFKPLHVYTLRFMKKWESLAAALTILLVFITVLIPLTFIGYQIFHEAQDLYLSIASEGEVAVLSKIETFINTKIVSLIPGAQPVNFSEGSNIDTYVKESLNWLFRNVGSLLTSVTSFTLNFFIFLLAFFYLLKDGGRLKEELVFLSPLPDKYDEEISGKLEVAVNSIIRGSLTVAVIQGFLTGIGFATFGVPSPAFWGAVAAVASLVPALGTAVVTVPGIIFLFVTGNIFGAIGLALWGGLAVGLVDNFIGPKLVQRGTKLHSFLVLLFALGGLSLFGPIGFLLGPIILSLLVALIDVYILITKEVDLI